MAGKNKTAGEPTLAELKKRHDKGVKGLATVKAIFTEAHDLPEDDRQRSQGRLGAEEAEGLRGVIDAMDARPGVFEALADKDGGKDPKKLETELLRDGLDRHALYLDLADKAEALARLFRDQALAHGARVAPVLRAGYEIAKPVSKNDAVIRGKIAKLLNYHGANAQASIAARQSKKGANGPKNG